MAIKNDYQSMDFSQFSKVKESLRQRLHKERLWNQKLDWDDLDALAAAGTPLFPPKDPHSTEQ